MSRDYFVNLISCQPHLQNMDAVTVRYHYLAAVEQGKTSKETNGLRQRWAKARLPKRYISFDSLPLWSWIVVPAVDLADLPDFCFFLQFPFRLAKPYLSKDERAFYIRVVAK